MGRSSWRSEYSRVEQLDKFVFIGQMVRFSPESGRQISSACRGVNGSGRMIHAASAGNGRRPLMTDNMLFDKWLLPAAAQGESHQSC